MNQYHTILKILRVILGSFTGLLSVNRIFYLADEYEMCCVEDASSHKAVIFLEEQ